MHPSLSLMSLVLLLGCLQTEPIPPARVAPTDMAPLGPPDLAPEAARCPVELPGGPPAQDSWIHALPWEQDSRISALVRDQDGNVLIAGWFSRAMEMPGLRLISRGASDAFVAKFTRSGGLRWARRLGGEGREQTVALAVDSLGHITAAIRFSGQMDFGTGPIQGGPLSLALVGLTPAGCTSWSSYVGDGEARGLAVDRQGRLVLVWMNKAAPGITLSSYSPGGDLRWSHRFKSDGLDAPLGVSVDPTGQITMAGTFTGTIDVGGGLLQAAHQSSFLARYSAAGEHLWSRSVGVAMDIPLWDAALATDRQGRVVLAGDFTDRIDLGTGIVESRGPSSFFVAQFDHHGTTRWVRTCTSPGTHAVRAVTTDSEDRVYVGGTMDHPADCGLGIVPIGGERSALLLSYDAAGQPLFSEVLGLSPGSQIEALGASPEG
jgi:hypothetical protein